MRLTHQLLSLAGLAVLMAGLCPCPGQPTLGEPPRAPQQVSGLPGRVIPLMATGGFSANPNSREETRAFYNALYLSSQDVPMGSSADVSSCWPGTNSPAFQDAAIRCINWFRAMAGVPASVTRDDGECAENQQAAVMMSANFSLDHFPPANWTCYTAAGANAASNSNLALGSAGAEAVTGYLRDFGTNNFEVGHRRWLLYPQTQVMATGDVPSRGAYYAANATWVFDANLFGPRPATRQPYVAWPPAGYVPCQVVFPQWSFALSNADLSMAAVSMTSNGVSVAVTLQPYQAGYGENSLVWVPMGLDFASDTAVFPFNGTDTVYGVTITNINAGGSMIGFNYTVTVFDPSVPGVDYVAPAISGPAQPYVNWANSYSCVPVNNSQVTGYQWRVSQAASGSLFDGAENGLTNFTALTSPGYSVITNTPVAAGHWAFYLVHPLPAAQVLQLNEVLFPAANTLLSFKSRLGHATTSEVARVQVSVDGGSTWEDIYTQPGAGTNSPGETTFSLRTASLSNCAGQPTLLRFDYDFTSGPVYDTVDPKAVGWVFDNILLTNTEALVNLTTNATATNIFVFNPPRTGNYNLEAQAVIFGDFPIGWGPVDQVTAVSNATPVIRLSSPVVANNQLRLDFTLLSGSSRSFTLLQAGELGGTWTTNTTATLTTNGAGSYRFAATVPPVKGFYRVRAP
ncbi:MAG: CAP domain-containing protein [Verrucomicrobiota bacterium]